ncbi:unnamed protein product [Durusdinium trenchii]|uniref:EB domain-containing protein n=1 Tax=Durusdinium trenchii TaxID=1381693 RepID=A0ABP0P501_9DINO
MPSGQKMPLLSTASEISTHTCTMYIRNPSPLASLVAQAHFWGSQHPVSKMRRWFCLWPVALIHGHQDVELRALEADEDCTQAADGSCSLELLQAGSRREAWDDEPTAWGDLSHYGRFTGGTCSFWNCDQSRGPTICHHLKCICAEGYLAFAGTCRSESEQPTTALGTRTGETCRMGYCTVPHSTCKAGKCFCGRGYTANNGVCQVVRCIWRTGCLFWCLVLSVELGLVESTGPKGTTAEILLVENCEIGKRR